jgi:hypothetical protein
LQLRYNGGTYVAGLRTIEPRQTVMFDVRSLRDQQVPDETGRPIPLEAVSGQVNWSMRGPQNQVLIGRSEQVDIAGGISSNYACMNCCPDSFSGGWIDPGGIEGFVGENLQVSGLEQTVNCYGSFNAPYNPWPSWDSTNWDVLGFCSDPGLGSADGPGTANAQARWLAYKWGSFESGNPNECYERPIDVLVEALCDVLSPEILLKNAKILTVSGDFSGFSAATQTATLKMGSSQHAIPICGDDPQLFTITVNFTLPPGGELVPSRCTARPFNIPDHDYNVGTVTCVIDDSFNRTGHMSIEARRRCCPATDENPLIKFVVGANKSGPTGTIDTPGTVKVLCNQ